LIHTDVEVEPLIVLKHIFKQTIKLTKCVHMKISIIGSGYVGIVTGVCLADLGHEITFLDIDRKKVEVINANSPPIFEKGLEELMKKNSSRISATTEYSDAIQYSDVTFLCVGTPSDISGAIDLTHIKSAAADLGRALVEKSTRHTILIKSTVLPGTTENIILPILENASGKNGFINFGLGTNPEFLREGVALNDFMHSDRIIMGVQDSKTREIFDHLYSPFSCPKFFTSIKTAEMIKYVNNAFLATKISFANEIGNICKQNGIDTEEVFTGVGLDARINPAFFQSGIGFGGSCLPKDVRALIVHAEKLGEDPKLLNAVSQVNERQPLHVITLLKKYIPILKNKKVGILGLAFKPDTDDIRESRSIPIIEGLIAEGAQIVAYDPVAIEEMRHLYPMIKYAISPKQILQTDAVIIATKWKQFEDLDYSGKTVIDGRRIRKAEQEASIYEGVCW
jgi:UDPglucose 6-dehydrogenase